MNAIGKLYINPLRPPFSIVTLNTATSSNLIRGEEWKYKHPTACSIIDIESK